MSQPTKPGIVGGSIGSAIGGTAWLIVIGIYIKSLPIVLITVVGAILCITGAIKLFSINPARKFSILGLLILWLVVLNFAMGNIIYDRIPDTIGGISTGKEQFSLVQFNIFLAMMSILGFFFIVKDILSKKDV